MQPVMVDLPPGLIESPDNQNTIPTHMVEGSGLYMPIYLGFTGRIPDDVVSTYRCRLSSWRLGV